MHSSIKKHGYQQEVLCCIQNIELLLEERAEYPALDGPLRVYGPPRSVQAALALSVRYLIAYVTKMTGEWERMPQEFQIQVADAFDRAVIRLGWDAEKPRVKRQSLDGFVGSHERHSGEACV